MEVTQEPQRAAVLGLGALVSLTRAHILRHVDVLAHPKSDRWTCELVLASPKCLPNNGPAWNSRSICARSPPPAGMQRRSVSPCPRRYRSPHLTRNVPPFSARARSVTGPPNRSTSAPSAAAAPRMIGPKTAATVISTIKPSSSRP